MHTGILCCPAEALNWKTSESMRLCIEWSKWKGCTICREFHLLNTCPNSDPPYL